VQAEQRHGSTNLMNRLRYWNPTALMSIDTISISVIGRRSGPRV